MARFDGGFDQREQIRDAIDIVDLVERYVPLRRQGANFVGLCPWHDDTRPSLQVNAARQTFKCWVCDIGGDVFSFIMKIENVDFKESMKILADMAGIELKRFSRTAQSQIAPSGEQWEDVPSKDDGAIEISKTTLYRALEWLADKYRETFLHSPEAEEARRYVEDRGVSASSSELYKIGYAPLGYDEVLNWIGNDRKRVKVLEAAGVLAYRDEYDESGLPKPRPKFAQTEKLSDAEKRKYYDRFRGRLVFPICDVQDRVVAFGGRLLPNTTLRSPAKYVNSPETPIFQKSKMLYGLDRARTAIRQSDVVLVTEGYTDCIITAQFGFKNVVAVLGTALGADHVRILKRFASKMILILDGDEAGRKRANEVLRFFVEQGVDLSVLILPDNNDPCDFLLEKGPEQFRNLIENKTVDALDHAFYAATAGIDLDNDVVGSAKALDSLLDVAALFPKWRSAGNDPIRLRMIGTLQRFATRFHVSEEELQRQLREKRSQLRERDARSQLRDERRAQYAHETEGQRLDDDSPERQIELYRRQWVYPISGPDGESDEQLRSLFPPFETTLWNDFRFMPNALEREYLEFWFTDPTIYKSLVANIANDDLRSPVARQIDLLGRDALERSETPTFEMIMLRYEDAKMKEFLIGLDSAAVDKGLPDVVKDPPRRDALLREIIDGFDRARVDRELPKQINLLRESATPPEERLQTLLELRRQQQERQRKLKEQD
ncbi:MAG: DNA primase [Thermoguttaceae bacterium]